MNGSSRPAEVPAPTRDTGDAGGDADLLERIVGRDATAMALLYERYSRVAFGLAYRLLHDPMEAEDVVQDAFLAVWTQATSYGPARGTVRSWLLAIVHHRAIDRLRRRAGRADGPDQGDQSSVWAVGSDPTDQVCRRADAEAVRAALQGLPGDQQRAIVLAYFGGYTHDEVARLLELPLGTAKGRLRLGLQKLRQQMQITGALERDAARRTTVSRAARARGTCPAPG